MIDANNLCSANPMKSMSNLLVLESKFFTEFLMQLLRSLAVRVRNVTFSSLSFHCISISLTVILITMILLCYWVMIGNRVFYNHTARLWLQFQTLRQNLFRL